jgi:hypothetical protein
MPRPALQIAFIHLTYNVLGVILIFGSAPAFPAVRRGRMAGPNRGRRTRRSRWPIYSVSSRRPALPHRDGDALEKGRKNDRYAFAEHERPTA